MHLKVWQARLEWPWCGRWCEWLRGDGVLCCVCSRVCATPLLSVILRIVHICDKAGLVEKPFPPQPQGDACVDVGGFVRWGNKYGVFSGKSQLQLQIFLSISGVQFSGTI